MSSFLFNLIIKPIELILEIVFALSYRVLNNAGIAIICVSLAVSVLTIPLYKRADAIQDEEREKKKKMDRWVTHIRRTFKGDERIMLLNEYYRQQNYKPIYALRSSLSLLLQIPFFIAAYRYLSSLAVLQGTSFLWISDLGKPDQMLRIGGITVNLLPILMTLINCISGTIYTKGLPIRDKLQVYGIAAVFLVFLYYSPSGLVFYWTMNNVFSLGKNILKKLVKRPNLWLNTICAGTGIALFAFLIASGRLDTLQRKCFSVVVLLVSFLPAIGSMVGRKRTSYGERNNASDKNNIKLFIISGVFLTLLIGTLIPSGIISAGAQEFINVNHFRHPAHFIWETTIIAAGYFLFWGNILYYLAEKSQKGKYSLIFVLCSICFFINFMFFGKKLGTVSTSLVFDSYPTYALSEVTLNVLALIFVVIFVYLVWKRNGKLLKDICLLMTVAILGVSVYNLIRINSQISGIKVQHLENDNKSGGFEPVIHLSKNGKNVLVLMLDRAISRYIPYIINEKPELKEVFSGFVYYPNTISFGLCTNYGAPPLFGGYEYTPIEMDRRNTELLEDKHNEALKVMPVLFLENGFDVTICDPPYAGYEWIPDLSIYSDYEKIKAYNLQGKYTYTVDGDFAAFAEKQQERNFLFYSFFKTAPVFLQTTIYDRGNYFSTGTNHSQNKGFLDWYSILTNLNDLTNITEDDENTFFMSDNKTAHEVSLLQMPDYVPAVNIYNDKWDDPTRFVLDGQEMRVKTEEEKAHYHSNMACYLQLAKWFEFLKENGVYDNTRIILVSDHGYRLRQFSDWDLWADNEVECVNPLLMVKDFNSTGFTTDYKFMTNADVPTLATDGLIDDPVNPFTGKPINSDEKMAHDQIITTNWLWNIKENNGTTFNTEGDGHWYSIHDNIFDAGNWVQLEEEPLDQKS